MASLLLPILLLALLISPSQADTAICTSQTFNNSNVYTNYADLPSLGSCLHWTYNASNSSLAVAFVFVGYRNYDSWIAWAINPTGTGMVGAQALVAYILDDGTPAVKTYNITSYSSIIPGKLSFDVWNVSAEYTSAFTIFATVKVPEKAETVNQVWQVGGGFNKITGMIEKHSFAAANLISYGPLSLVATGTPNTRGDV
ncbi:hypothetical protein M0R45_020759 [Rubus argutus]|uniref:DOMON domain-containing protein n=1 Tax=Rubus argutus TaxID=59490 RepID=A0AAW1XBM3_RUBAR